MKSRHRISLILFSLVASFFLLLGGIWLLNGRGGTTAGRVARAASESRMAAAPLPDGGPGIGLATTPSGGAKAVAVNQPKPGPKLQSDLAQLASAQATGGQSAAGDFAARHGMKLNDGRVTVVEEAAPGQSAQAQDQAQAADGKVEAVYQNLVQASVPVNSLSSLAASPQIAYVREPEHPTVTTTSEGVADSGADVWHSAGETGTGVKIAVLDPGFAGYTQRISEGNLPANVITKSFRSDGDITGGGQVHGTACAEIVYDMAPGAQLYLVNFDTDVDLGNAINYIESQGINVVSASWGFYGEFQDNGQGTVDDMVKGANAAGIFWANASGNAAQSHWSGHFTDANNDTWNEFAPGDQGNDVNLSAGQELDVYLTWDKWPVTDQDYDLYLFWSGNPSTPVASSANAQTGTQPPAEEIHYTVPSGQGGLYWIGIKNYSATGDANFQLYTYPNSLQYQVPQSSLGGQPTDSPYAMTTGAVAVGTTAIEYFSSQGPTLDGRIKPDIVGPDRVTTATYGYTGFWGTSAATPHVAGAAALVKEENPTFGPADIQASLESKALDLGAPGKDDVFGSGKLQLGAFDNIPPAVTQVSPSGKVNSDSAAIEVYYSDAGSGVNPASVNVTLDGASLSGCSKTAAYTGCAVTGLTAGNHVIGGSVSDYAGNTSAISGSFTVTCGQPQLIQTLSTAYWATYDDYKARLLSVDWTFSNTGVNDATNVQVTGSANTNNVLFSLPVPVSLGDIPAAGNKTITGRYTIPENVSSFRSTTYVTAQDDCGKTYYYPAPFSAP